MTAYFLVSFANAEIKNLPEMTLKILALPPRLYYNAGYYLLAFLIIKEISFKKAWARIFFNSMALFFILLFYMVYLVAMMIPFFNRSQAFV